MIALVWALLRRFGGGHLARQVPDRARPVAVTDPAERRRWWRLFATLEQRLALLDADGKNKRREG